jgi:hypothetical protein
MVVIMASRFKKFLEALSYFSKEVLLVPEDEWLSASALDKFHVTAAYAKLRLESPLYNSFGVDVRRLLRFLRGVTGELTLNLEGKKLTVEGHGFTLKVDTIDPQAFKPVAEPQLSFDLVTDVEIDQLAESLRHLKRVDVTRFVGNKDGLWIEASSETSRYSQWLGTPTFLSDQIKEVSVKFLTQFLKPIVDALSVLSRPPSATGVLIELKTSYPGRFSFTDNDLHFRAYIAPRLVD